MKKTIFTGAGVAIVTPFTPNGEVDYERLSALVDWQVKEGTDAIIVCGTTGESPTLTDEEHRKCIEIAVKSAAGRIPVIAGTGSNDTAYAIDLSMHACEAGVDGLLLVTPYYNKTSQRGLIQHYTKIADHVTKPMILYNVPSRTGVDIKPETLFELSKHENIQAVKEANGSISAVARTAALCGDNLDIYSGNDDQTVPILSLGGKGVISVASNIVPRVVHDMCAAYFAGDVHRSCKMQLDYLRLMEGLFTDVNPIPVKTAMNRMGLHVGGLRLPLCEMSEKDAAALDDMLRSYNLI